MAASPGSEPRSPGRRNQGLTEAFGRRYKAESANDLVAERGSEMNAPPDDLAFRAPTGVSEGSAGRFLNHRGARSSPDELPES